VPIVVPTPNTVITSAWGKSVADALNAIIPHELAYTQSTATKLVTVGVEASADAVVIGPAVTYDGATPVIVECFAPAVVPAAVAGANVMLWLYQDGVSIGRLATVQTPAAGVFIAPVHLTRRITPTAGSHQYTFAATVNGGNGNVFAGTGGLGQYQPSFIRVTRAA
jgi:hypothetical protein